MKGIPSISETLHLQARHSNIVMDLTAKSVIGPQRCYPNTKGLVERNQGILKLLHVKKGKSKPYQADRNVGMVATKGISGNTSGVLKAEESIFITLFYVTGIRLALGVLAVNSPHVMHG